jgi:hypothetical protein
MSIPFTCYFACRCAFHNSIPGRSHPQPLVDVLVDAILLNFDVFFRCCSRDKIQARCSPQQLHCLFRLVLCSTCSSLFADHDLHGLPLTGMLPTHHGRRPISSRGYRALHRYRTQDISACEPCASPAEGLKWVSISKGGLARHGHHTLEPEMICSRRLSFRESR